jgi:pilus assembly protein CpaE
VRSAPLGQVVSAGGGSLDELLALVDVTFASLVFVGLDREHVVAQSALIEGALEAKPMLAIVALGDGMDNQLVLNAMRAGARILSPMVRVRVKLPDWCGA